MRDDKEVGASLSPLATSLRESKMVDDNVSEEWRTVEGHPGYEVSSLGRVRSVDRWVLTENWQNRFYRGKPIVPWVSDEYGHLSVNLGRQWKGKLAPLICSAFNGPRPSSTHEAAHWDGDPSNNLPSNLRWATSQENKADMVRHGTAPRGERCGTSKLKEDQVKEIRRMRSSGGGMTFQAIADKFHVSYALVHYICGRKRWTHLK